MSNQYQINLLTDTEVEELYARPKFTDDERAYYFHLNHEERSLLSQQKELKSKLYFVLQFGYFKAGKRFHRFTLDEAQEDVNFLLDNYFELEDEKLSGPLWKEIYRKQKQAILNYFDYNDWSNALKPKVLDHLRKLVRLYPKGNDTLRELFAFMDNEKIVIPTYRTIQDLFTKVFAEERQRLNKSVNDLPPELKEKLERIISYEDGVSQLNVIRYDQKDFKYNSLKSEITKVEKLTDLYQRCKTLIPSLNLSNNAVRYYGGLIEQYSPAKLRKISKPQLHLYALCFIYHRYQEFIDNLITSFLFHLRKLMEEAKIYAKDKEIEYFKSLKMEMPKLAEFLEWFSSDEKYSDLNADAFKQLGFSILPKEKQIELASYIYGIKFDKEAAVWEYYESSSRFLALYLRPILLAVDFEYYKSDALLPKLMSELKRRGQVDFVRSKASTCFTSSSKSPAETCFFIWFNDQPKLAPPFKSKYLAIADKLKSV